MSQSSNNERALILLTALSDSVAIIAQHAGLSVDEVISAIRSGFAKRPNGGEPFRQSTDVLPEYRELGAMMAAWRSQGEYTDELGNPKPIPALGPAPSLQSLFEQIQSTVRNPELSLEAAIEHLHSYGTIAIAEGTDDLYAQKLVAVKLTRSGNANPVAVLSYLVEFAQTIAHNVEELASGSTNTLFQATSEVPNVPRLDVPRINRAFLKDAYAFLEQIDQLMESAASAPSSDDEPRQKLGVGVYLFGTPVTIEEGGA